MKKVLISVIVPIYNVEQYLVECIDSILAQTLIDFELLLINDASKDESLNICYQYAKKDKRIIVFNIEINVGVTVARNIGIENSSGKYIVFIDSDDLVLKNHLESLYYSSNIPPGTLVHAPHLISRNGLIIGKDQVQHPYSIQNIFNNDKNKFDFLFAGPPWSKLLENEIIKFNNIRFRLVNINDDYLFHLEYLMHINGYKNVGEKTLIYFQRTGSLTRKKFPFEDYIKFVKLSIPLTTIVLERFHIQDKLLQISLFSTPINALISSIFALYRFPSNKSKIDRINCLTMVLGNYSNYLNDYWLPTDLQNRIVKMILNFKSIIIIDFFLQIIVFFRYLIISKASSI
jgi:glycosyltransferase involved in cell wall biosynthesis